ncbi:unnamed protein product [Vitrella brassicaformis CCMP3155]|uniref:Uncharacterized protein n=1 Tax=Vitrella brassicaformis (strain CCMP3155) TaxID=1169540 RepID=A0A0G4EL12_VITBC|nr:unnamed protein product [Vitrella brassicaformis CCMP3155]|eukprot:CEL97637.1 unnamed protein product [Vitrella brassicaformis CCMP3155]
MATSRYARMLQLWWLTLPHRQKRRRMGSSRPLPQFCRVVPPPLPRHHSRPASRRHRRRSRQTRQNLSVRRWI